MKKYTHEKAHEEIDYIFKTLLPQRGMAERPEQIRLCHSILDAMLDGSIALCDAGTGIGKTFAYLTAGILHGKCRAAEGKPQRPKPLTQNVRLGLDTHKHRRSLNVLVIGGSGAAKTRSYVLPNILEANTNYVITDPKMEVLTATGGYLKSQGYDVRVLNLVNLEQSDGYNPFRYIRDEKDALRLVNNLIQATTPKNSHESDPFWTKAETALLQAIILMLFQEAPESEQNFSMVMRVLEYAEVCRHDGPGTEKGQ